MKQIYVLKEPIGKVSKAGDIFSKISKINIDYTQENFLIFYLDTGNKVIKSEILFKGGLNACLIDPKTLFRKALSLNANSVIVAHNHPSGNLEPSPEDISIYEKLKEIGYIITINCLDAIIFNKTIFYSLMEAEK